MKVAVLFDNLGPYHRARLRQGAAVVELTAIQCAVCSKEYGWRGSDACDGFPLITLDGAGQSKRISKCRMQIVNALNQVVPAVLAVPGWGSKAAIEAVRWAVRRRVPVIAMSASTSQDADRSRWKESVKYRYLELCSAGLVGGALQCEYFLKLGMPADRVFMGYDTVDNAFFRDRVPAVLRDAGRLRKCNGLPEQYFIASNRFIPKKNLPRLLTAFAAYRRRLGSAAWELVIIGDGDLRGDLEQQLAEMRLLESVHLPGFKQYNDLPVYYGLASAFIHASTVEQWGLVVNEAMASGLPVVVSERCGCVPDLVQDGVNGWTFNPYNVGAMTDAMVRMTELSEAKRGAMGEASQRIIADWGPERFAAGLKAAAEKALEVGPKRASMLDRVMLGAMAGLLR